MQGHPPLAADPLAVRLMGRHGRGRARHRVFRVVRHRQACRGRLGRGHAELAARRVGVSRRGRAARAPAASQPPGRQQGGPVRQREVLLDGRGQVLDGQVGLPGGERGDAQGVLRGPEAGDAEAADHRQVRVREKQLKGPGGHRQRLRAGTRPPPALFIVTSRAARRRAARPGRGRTTRQRAGGPGPVPAQRGGDGQRGDRGSCPPRTAPGSAPGRAARAAARSAVPGTSGSSPAGRRTTTRGRRRPRPRRGWRRPQPALRPRRTACYPDGQHHVDDRATATEVELPGGRAGRGDP